jgi:hypothetical protein
MRPGKQAQTQVDGGRIERVQGVIELDAQGILGIKRTGDGNQNLREVGKMRQSCASLASAKVERDTLPRSPR